MQQLPLVQLRRVRQRAERDIHSEVAALEVKQFGQSLGEHDIAGLGHHAFEDRGHPGGDALTDFRRASKDRVEDLECQWLCVLRQQLRLARHAYLVDQGNGDLLHHGLQFVLADMVESGRVRCPVTGMSGTRTAQRVGAVLQHRQDRTVRGDALLPDPRAGGEPVGVVADADRGLIANHSVAGTSGSR